jgi:hypothetical protein
MSDIDWAEQEQFGVPMGKAALRTDCADCVG